ncbi:MAG: biopolymer transporter ExbD [Acidobacteriota bacterium]|nr:MAG: biopolymer transporter ExbD [Acidobacteriota bacterium]
MRLCLSRPKIGAQISTASMADIAFLLIIFFMLTAVFSATRGLDLELPPLHQPTQPPVDPARLITILEDGSVELDGFPLAVEDLLAALGPALAGRADQPIVVYTRKRAPYTSFIAVIDQLRRAPLPREQGGLGLARPLNVSIPTRSEIETYVALCGHNPFDPSEL